MRKVLCSSLNDLQNVACEGGFYLIGGQAVPPGAIAYISDHDTDAPVVHLHGGEAIETDPYDPRGDVGRLMAKAGKLAVMGGGLERPPLPEFEQLYVYFLAPPPEGSPGPEEINDAGDLGFKIGYGFDLEVRSSSFAEIDRRTALAYEAGGLSFERELPEGQNQRNTFFGTWLSANPNEATRPWVRYAAADGFQPERAILTFPLYDYAPQMVVVCSEAMPYEQVGQRWCDFIHVIYPHGLQGGDFKTTHIVDDFSEAADNFEGSPLSGSFVPPS